MDFITALLYLQQSDTNAEVHNLVKILTEREKNIAIEKRRRQVQRDRKFLEKYNPDDTEKPFDAEKYFRYLDIKNKYATEKDTLIKHFQTKNITEFTEYPESLSPEDFLTWEDYNEADNARAKFELAVFEFQRKKNRRSFFWRVLGFLAVLAFIAYVSYAGA